MAVQPSTQTLQQIAEAGVAVPDYDRSGVTTGIVHIGVGGFFRAHQAMYLDRLLNQGEALDFGICGVAALPHDRRIFDAMTSQDCLYTLVLKHPDGRLEPRLIGSMTQMLFAPDDPSAVVARMADPATRIVSLTITEGGYPVDQVTGKFQADHPSIQADLVPGATPRTAFGFIVAALAARRVAGVNPFTVQSCDNLPGNGDVARSTLVSFARLIDSDLADWIERTVAFPNAMVDRITPMTTDDDRALLLETFGVDDAWPVFCEPFTQWVIEDHFPAGRPRWEDVGAQMVDDVLPYELMKLRLLNASHQAFAYLGHLDGHRYAHEVCQQPIYRDFLLRYMEREATPTLPEVPGVDLDAYRHELVDRFASPAVRDTLARLATETSDRIPKFLVPVIRANVLSGGEIEASALVVASWARYAEGTDEQGEPIEVVDNDRDRVMAAAAASKDDPLEFLRMRDYFGDLVDDPRFVEAYTRHLSSLRTTGARATLEAFMA
ncbi:mannitol dehydrogenase family protein [Aestuariimicrobium ganziense]|uniref:mannitol dehydrogenase family protein n=1 Tax=Aestuariimicrobium ganziense TaxID=2773677 RepID=UPI0019434CA6|nr:mannitol dehydrogenase family protein [Aestuariimicrobium ganziense]